jgi:hypothetical protein
MTRENCAINLLRKARRTLVDEIVDTVLDSEHLAEHGELPPFSDSITEAGDRLAELTRTIYALEDAIEDDAPPKPTSCPWVYVNASDQPSDYLPSALSSASETT